MKLADYLHKHRITPTQLRQMLGLQSRSAVWRYLTGERRPNLRTLQDIIELTKGQVQLADFLDPRPPDCATWVTLPDGRTRLVFPWSNRDADLDASLATLQGEDMEGDGPSDTARKAFAELGPQLKERRDGLFELDGKTVDLRRVIAAANEVRARKLLPPLPYPGLASGVKR